MISVIRILFKNFIALLDKRNSFFFDMHKMFLIFKIQDFGGA
jgi:hypothetical protein